ncbi:MAG: nitroreductase family protein [Kibdelosporangium sp.]
MLSAVPEIGTDPARADTWFRLFDLKPEVPLDRDRWHAPALDHAVDVVERALLRDDSATGRAVPSAGAIFPYEVLVLVPDTGGAALFRLDLLRRNRVRLPVAADVAGRVATELQAHAPDSGSHVLLLARPWLSMRKYGPRGYLYTLLDTGHAATALLGEGARLRLGVPRDLLGSALATILPHRDVHAVISLGRPGRPTSEGRWSGLVQRRTGATQPDELEQHCWSTIPEWLVAGTTQVRGIGAAPVVQLRCAPRDGVVKADEWAALTRSRQSCKNFEPGGLSREAVYRTLLALATPLPTDLPAGKAFRLTFMAAPGRVAQACRAAVDVLDADLAVSRQLSDRDTVVAACNGQQHLACAQLFVLCRIRRSALPADNEPQGLRDALFRAAAAAHLVYLGAARSGMAVTAVGGFDADRWRELAGLSDDEEIVYVVALGFDGTATRKHDRAELAHAHGE